MRRRTTTTRTDRLLAVGRLGPGPEAALFARLNARLRPPLAVTEIADGRGTAVEIRRREAASLLAALSEGGFLVVLDLGVAAPDTAAFAALTTRWADAGRAVTYAIGGAEGLDPAVLARADHVLSLGPLTWPHLLVRGLLAEQLYRAQAMRTGHPYHRDWRP